jgi:hypothetical protein
LRELKEGVPAPPDAALLVPEIEALLRRARETLDNSHAFAAARLLALVSATEAGALKSKFKEALGDKLNLNDLSRAISQEGKEAARPAPVARADGDLPAITVTSRQLRDMTDEALAALHRANDPPQVFMRGGSLVRVSRDEKGRPSIHDFHFASMRGRLTQVADFFGRYGDLLVGESPPKDLVLDLLARGLWNFPTLEVVVQIPVLRPDGTILSEPGYDPATSLFYMPPPGFQLPKIPAEPTRIRLAIAKRVIEDAIGDFPFVGGRAASYANTIALMLTLIVIPASGHKAPMALLDAPQVGTGKSLLAEFVSAIALGQQPGMITCAGSEEEWGKVITSALLGGSTLNLIDNVRGTLDSAKLSAMLTLLFWSDRLLGGNRMVTLRNRAVWIASGNNIKVAGDMPRRTYLIRLDAEMSRPFERPEEAFKHPELVAWALDHQAEILGALFTLARHWYAIGQPRPKVKNLGGFSYWLRVVGGILEQAGISDFLGNRDVVFEACDDESSDWINFLTALEECFPNQAFTVAQVVQSQGPMSLEEALPGDIRCRVRADGFSLALGRAFARNADRRFTPDGLRITRQGIQHRVMSWRVMRDNSPVQCVPAPIKFTSFAPEDAVPGR